MRESVFVNLSNHPSGNWSEKQLAATRAFAADGEQPEIADLPFPHVAPRACSDEIDALVEQYFQKIMKRIPAAVMVQGEFVFTYRMVARLKASGIKAVSACTERRASEEMQADGTVTRTSTFDFVMFREY